MKVKKIISSLLVAILVLSYIPMFSLSNAGSMLITANAAESIKTGDCGENLTWTLNAETGELVISGTGDTIEGLPYDDDFRNQVKSVVLPGNIKTIGASAFYKYSFLEKVSFKEPLEGELVINAGAFHGCYSLKNVELPEGVTIIENNAFSNCSSLEKIVIPASVTYLGTYCFFECASLETVEFAEGSRLKKLGTSSDFGPFARCYNLKNITLPDSVEEIGWGTFSQCISLESINIPKNIKDVSFIVADGYNNYGAIPSLKEITVDSENEAFLLDENGSLYVKNSNSVLIAAPNKEGMKTLKILPYSAFNITSYRYITNIDKIEVAEGVKGFSTDENGVLYNENKTTLLKYPAEKPDTEFMIPASVTSIDSFAFYGAENLKSFTVEEGNKTFTTEDGVLYTADKTAVVAYPLGKTSKEFEFKSTVSGLNIIDFIFAKNIEKFSVEAGNKYLEVDEDGVLYLLNDGKKTVILYPCGRKATEYTVKDNTYAVYADAFYCSNVKTLNIPKTVALISTYAFMTKKFQCINYEGTSLFDNVKQANRLLAVSTVNNSVNWATLTGYVNGKDSATKITYSYEIDCFDNSEEVMFSVIPESKENCEDEFGGYADESDDIFFYTIKFYVVENHKAKVVQPCNGKKVKVGFPIPEDYKNADSNLFMIVHKRTDNGKLEFFKLSKNNMEIKNGYIYIWTDNFSPFALMINYKPTEKTVSSISIASLPSKTSYDYKSENMDLTGLALTVTYSDGSEETVTDTSKMNVTGFDSSKTGTHTVTVEYEGYTENFDVTVSYAWWQWIIRIILLGFLWY